MLVSFTLGLWLAAVGGCGRGATAPTAPVAAWVNPLAEAPERLWRQQVWFVADADETVEALVADTRTGAPIVYLARADGSRRGVLLTAPGLATEVQYVRRTETNDTLTASSPDDSLRVAIAGQGALVVTATDTRSGGRTVLVRDVADRRLVHPSVDAARSAVYVAEAGELGGLFRLDVAGRKVDRIVPERDAALPLAWPTEGGERVVYVEGKVGGRVVVAEPPGTLPPRPAAEMLREGKLPANLVPVIVEPGGSVVRLATCTPPPPLAWKPSQDDVLRLDVAQNVGFGRAVFCGRGCTELLTGSPAGATRLAARFEHDADHDVWGVWFAPDLPVEGGTYATPERAAGVPEVPACLPALDPVRWLVEPRWHGNAVQQISHLVFAGEVLYAYGLDRNRPFSVALSEKTGPIVHFLLSRRDPPPDDRATTSGATAKLAAGGIRWVEAATGAESEVLPPASDRQLRDPMFDGSGSTLYLVDEGASPGLLHVALQKGELTRVVPGKGLRRPIPGRWGDQELVGYVRRRDDGHTEVGTARPVTAAEADAWTQGPMSLVAFEPVWLPIAVRDGRVVRCEAPDRIEIGVDAAGGFLKWGDVRVPARAATFDGALLRLLGDRDGTPVVLAELRVEGPAAHWWPRGVPVERRASSWAPAKDVEALPIEGPCNPWE